MPRKPIDYNKGLIYKLEKDGIAYYVGSTTNFTKRKSHHKDSCNHINREQYNYPIYKFIRDNGGWDDFKMVLIENYKCNDSNELFAREQHWINEFKPTLLNINNAVALNAKQYYIENQEKIKKNVAKYNLENKEAITKRATQYIIDNKDVINKRRTQRRIDNKEVINKRRAESRIGNKELINKQQRDRYRAKHPIEIDVLVYNGVV